MNAFIHVEVDEEILKKLVADYISGLTGRDIDKKNISIQVKSKQNYKSDWEEAEYKAVYKRQLNEID